VLERGARRSRAQPLIHEALRYPPVPRFWVYTMYAIVLFTFVGMVIAITKLA
jgi:hypothetical protein